MVALEFTEKIVHDLDLQVIQVVLAERLLEGFQLVFAGLLRKRVGPVLIQQSLAKCLLLLL